MLFCGVRSSDECSLGFAQMLLDAPFVLPLGGLDVSFVETPSAAVGAFHASQADVLVCMSTFKNNVDFVAAAIDEVASGRKGLVVGVAPEDGGVIDWAGVAEGRPAFRWDERILRDAVPESYDGAAYVRLAPSVDDVLARGPDCFVLARRGGGAAYVDIKRTMQCGVKVQFVGSVMPRVLNTSF